MRRLIVSVLTSLDGCYKGSGGDLSAMPFEDAFNDHNLGLLEAAGTLVYGGRWFTENWASWSAVAADPAQSERDHRIAELVLGTDSLVVSDSFKVSADDSWAGTARVVPRASGPAAIRELKQGDGGDLVVFGSGTMWNPLLAAGLVDEIIVLVGPAMLGDGVPVYRGPRAGLRLRSARVLTGSQLVELRYDADPTDDPGAGN